MMRRSRLMQGGAVALAMLIGGCAQAGAAGGPSVDDASGGPSASQYDLGDLGEAILALDPDNLPDPESSQVHLLVTEVACAGGKAADGRVTLERLVEHEDRVELVVGVEAPPGEGQTCPSNPPTPFTVELDEPLGARTLVDVAVYPERELATP
ncbi:hypothetical protein ACQEVI_25790 [Promicromonospora sp. CA-289599]|uniref:hypothetical protein n=1 Tax=Promicromonospora sp. CA-289599 TaxID=3240014 RepID=UPI003D90D7CB